SSEAPSCGSVRPAASSNARPSTGSSRGASRASGALLKDGTRTRLDRAERVYHLFLAGGRDLRRLVLRELAAAGDSSATAGWCLDLGAGGGHIGADLV